MKIHFLSHVRAKLTGQRLVYIELLAFINMYYSSSSSPMMKVVAKAFAWNATFPPKYNTRSLGSHLILIFILSYSLTLSMIRHFLFEKRVERRDMAKPKKKPPTSTHI